MSNIIYINKQKINEDTYVYEIGKHTFQIYRVISTAPAYPWRIIYNNEEKNSMFMHQYNAETYMINFLVELPEYKKNIFTIAEHNHKKQECECGKEKHKFFSHADWCPKSLK